MSEHVNGIADCTTAGGFGELFPSGSQGKPGLSTGYGRVLVDKFCPTEGWHRLPQPSCLSIPLSFLASSGSQLQRSTLPSPTGSDASLQTGVLLWSLWGCVPPAISFSQRQQQRLPVTLDFRSLNRTYSRTKVIAEINRL